jgi:predicted lipoprotein with Yx(FWY)xxD motif
MIGRRLALALLAVIALTLGACTASQTGGTAQPSTQAPTPEATSAAPTASAEDSEEPTESASDDSGDGDYPLDASSGAVGPYLTGEGGMTLYTFANDTQGDGKSVCNGDCATAWPPYLLEGDDEVTPGDGVTKEITTITRDDGTTQVAYDGWPLYYFQGDKAPGDTTGHELNDVWFVAAP